MNWTADLARQYARHLLCALACEADPAGVTDHPALAWRRAGLMAVTGRAEGPALLCPAGLAAAADGALLALRALAPMPERLPRNGALLLGERARLLGLTRQGRISANGTCRLLDAADGRIALNLARDDDWDLMPLLLGGDRVDGWDDVSRGVAGMAVAPLMELGVELGLPIALDAPLTATSPFMVRQRRSGRGERASHPLVLDFSALWAGPLAASLLHAMGAQVIKIESGSRLDGARRGDAGFYDLLNAGKHSVTIDFADPAQLECLRKLVMRADIVIEGSRPRALRRLGIDRAAAVENGCIWVSITGHADPDRVGFGDDAAIAAGLSSAMAEAWGEPLFAGDAIADPLTGLHAALAAWAAWHKREACLIQLGLATTTAYAMRNSMAGPGDLELWQERALSDDAPFYPLRPAAVSAAAPGADNAAFLFPRR